MPLITPAPGRCRVTPLPGARDSVQIAQDVVVPKPPARGLSQSRVTMPAFTHEEADPELLGIPTRLPNHQDR